MSDARTFTVPDFGPNDLLSSDKIGARRVKVSAAEFVPEVAKGNVPGHSIIYIHGFATAIGTTESLVWPLNRPIVFSDVPSNLYISSTNNTDTQAVLVQWLDDQYAKQQDVVQLAGQTPVLLGLGLRVNNMFTASTPATLGDVYCSNENNHSGGEPNNPDSVVAFYNSKIQSSSGLHYSVPAGHTVFGLSGYFSASKGKDYDFFWNIRNPAAGLPEINTNVLSLYESTVSINFEYTSIPEKTDAYFTAVTSGSAGRVSVRIPAMLVDNNFL